MCSVWVTTTHSILWYCLISPGCGRRRWNLPQAMARSPPKPPAGSAVSSVDLRPVFRRADYRRGNKATAVPARCSPSRGRSNTPLPTMPNQVTRLSVEFLNWASNQTIGKE